MRTVSFQGATLSGSERRSSQLRQQVRAAVNQSVLQQQVAATLNALEQHKEQGGKPEKVWSTISNEGHAVGRRCVRVAVMAIEINRQSYLSLRSALELELLDAGIDSPDLLSRLMRHVLATESATRAESQTVRRAFVTARRNPLLGAIPQHSQGRTNRPYILKRKP